MFRTFLVLFICCVGISAARVYLPEEPRPILKAPHLKCGVYSSLPGDKAEISYVPTECGTNEVYRCVLPCPLTQTCEDRAQNITCSEIRDCEYLCLCKEGYLRRFEGGECIPEIECGPVHSCGDNEKYTRFNRFCPNYTCSSIVNLPNCEFGEPYELGCTCKDGYYRKEEGSPCIPLCLCPEAQDSHDCSAWLSHYKQETKSEGL